MRHCLPSERNRASGQRGVTLIELLVVMAIISLLVGFGVWGLRAAQDAQSRALAKSQVTMIAAAVQQFKSELGFYPPGDGKGEGFLWLFNGVTVTRDSNGNITAVTRATNPGVAHLGPWLDTKGFSVEPSNGTFPVTKATDPWGNEFVYGRAIRTSPTASAPVDVVREWNVQGEFESYVVFSWGPLGNASTVISTSGAGSWLNYINRFGVHAE